jgi:hypothetical protein
MPGLYVEGKEVSLAARLLDYLPIYFGPLIAFGIGLATAGLGYGLLRAAGTTSREILPKQDYALLSKFLIDGNTDAITNYIRLGSLSGWIGAFTKLGISGLPLATIALTVFFTAVGLLIPTQTTLFDLAKLTLGAFIGSNVQRQSSDIARKVAAPGDLADLVSSTSGPQEKKPNGDKTQEQGNPTASPGTTTN